MANESAPVFHFILTRFNIRTFKKDKNKQQTHNSPDWLKHRLTLFRTYCFPSIKSQYHKNFQWLVGFDSETDPQVYQEFQTLKNFVPILVPHKKFSFNQACINHINSHLKTSSQLGDDKITIITTRIDSDDGFSRNAVKRIQNTAIKHQTKKHAFRAINLHRGLYLNEKTQQLIPEFIHFTSAYGSLIEYHHSKTKPVTKTVMSFTQGGLTEENKTIDIGMGQPMWLRVIHTRNVYNDRIIRQDIHHQPITEKDFLYIPIKYRRQLKNPQLKSNPVSTKNPTKTPTKKQSKTTKQITINLKPIKSTTKKRLSKRNPGIRRR